MSDIDVKLIEGLIESNTESNAAVKELSNNVAELVTQSRERAIKDQYQEKEIKEIKTRLSEQEVKFDLYVPTLVKAEEWAGIRTKVLCSVMAAVILAIVMSIKAFS